MPRRIPRPPWPWLALGLAAGIAAAFFLVIREPAEALTAEGLAEARARWRQNGPADYLMEVETGGAMEASHRVRVAEGSVEGEWRGESGSF